MTKSLIDKRTARLRWCHASVVTTLVVTASIGLCFSLIVLFQPIRECPVINAHFVLYWFYAAVEILQLLTGGTLLIVLIVFSCRRRQPPRHSPFTNQLMGAIGPTGHLFFFQSSCTGLPSNRNAVEAESMASDAFYRRKPGLIRCCRRRRRYAGHIGWLQPVIIVTGVVLIGHTVALIWASSTYRQLTGPYDTFESQLTSLFVEAKVKAEVHLIGKTHSLISGQCWNLIQRDFHCCGPTTYTDWFLRNSSLVNETQNRLPPSCFCQADEAHCRVAGTIRYADGYVFTAGCTKPVTLRLQGQSLSLIVIAPLSVALLLITFLNDVMYTLRTAQLVLQQQSGT